MITTYVLHGGETKTLSDSNNRFFSQFTSLVDKDEVNILMIYWCRDKSRWQAAFDRDTQRVLSETNKKVNFTMPQDPQDLFKLIDSYDVIYVAGGDAEPIESLYDQLDWLKEKLEGKVYLGSSMGAFMVSENYVLSYDAQDSLTVHQGLGILPINTLVHWDQEDKKDKKVNLLKGVSDLPIIVLDEGESVRLIS